jgi:uncharacterized protein (DUF2132 family)
MTEPPKKVDHLHGVTLKAMIEHLVDRYGWDGLGDRIAIRSFTHDPSVNSSLKFLRKTPWAREKVESLYVHSASHPRKTKTVVAPVQGADAGGEIETDN